jgi:heme/copper-type cytochrome/quinol oxidase subunit 3|tara:strand:- start:30 stop:602 length:573 start_codon:yes stop_codon:yes gene_type:complete
MSRPIATTRSATGIPTGRLALWWIVFSEIVIFGGLLAAYIMHRIGHPEWGYQAMHTNTLAGATNTFVLLTSSLMAVLAHQAAEKGDGKRAAKFLYLTVLGAVAFLVIKSFEWSHEIELGYVLQSGGFWSFYYTAAGIHGLHVIGGAIIMLIIAHDAKKGKDLQRVEYIGIYWHFVDLVWIFLFPLLYIAK